MTHFVNFLSVVCLGFFLLSCKSQSPSAAPIQGPSPGTETLPVLTPSPVTPQRTSTPPPPDKTHIPAMLDDSLPKATPTPKPKLFDTEIKLALMKWIKRGEQFRAIEYWILEKPYEVPRKVAEVDYDSYSSWAVWSHSGDKIAYFDAENNQPFLFVLNVNSLEKEAFPIPADQIKPDAPYISWSYDDRMLALTYMMETYIDIPRTVFIDTDTGSIEISNDGVQFCSWFREPADQYIYLEKTKTSLDYVAFHVQRVGEADPKLTIDGFEEGMEVRSLCDVAIAPDGNTGVMILSNVIQDYFFQANLNTGSWELLSYQPKGKYPFHSYFLRGWSPNGKWLLFDSDFDSYFWEFFQQSEPSEKPIRVTDSLNSNGWTGDSKWLVYQDGKAIYAVSPLDDQSPIKILGLPDLTEDTRVSLWVE